MARRSINLNDDSDEDIDGAAELDAMLVADENQRLPVNWRDRLMDNGDPQPQKILGNKRDKGAVCPRQEYIEATPDPPTLRELAIKWAVPYARIASWNEEQNWLAQRERYWISESQRFWEMNGAEVARIRGETLREVTGGFRSIRKLIEEMAELGQKPKYVNGVLVFMPFEPKDAQNMAKAYETAAKGELAALGLNLVVAKEGEEGDGENESSIVEVMVFNMPATDDEQKRIMTMPRNALPEGFSVSEVLEGEITGETGETAPVEAKQT